MPVHRGSLFPPSGLVCITREAERRLQLVLLQCDAGLEHNLEYLLLTWQEGLPTGPHQYPSCMPCSPTLQAFQSLLNLHMRKSEWRLAVDLALQCALLHPDAAQDGLRAMLAGARLLAAAEPDPMLASDMLAEDVGSSKHDLQDMLLAFARGCAKHGVSLLKALQLHFGLLSDMLFVWYHPNTHFKLLAMGTSALCTLGYESQILLATATTHFQAFYLRLMARCSRLRDEVELQTIRV